MLNQVLGFKNGRGKAEIAVPVDTYAETELSNIIYCRKKVGFL